MASQRLESESPDRVVPAAVTSARIEPLMERIGVTRVADVTRLDGSGICVHQAIRPNAWSLSVSQGKGLRLVDSRVGAMMEALEVWHAEQIAASLLGRSPRSLASRLSYDVMTLHLAPMSLLTPQTELDWVHATVLPDREPTLVPHAVVSLDLRVDNRWSPPLFARTSDGLASGNTSAEAELHALLEVVEREAVARRQAPGLGAPLSAATAVAMGERSSALLAMLDIAGVSWCVWDCTGPAELPCYVVTVSSEHLLRETAAGSGCHPDRDIALSTAILEATQARVAAIAGSRDDLRTDLAERPTPAIRRSAMPRPATSAPPDGPMPAGSGQAAIQDRVRDVVERITHEACERPLAVALTSPMGIPVVKIVAPGLRRSQ